MPDFDNSKAKKDSHVWNKSSNHFSSSFINTDRNSREKDEIKKDSISNINSSTLSLHIAAYEKATEDRSDGPVDDEMKVVKMKGSGLIKKWEAAKQFFNGSTTIIQVINFEQNYSVSFI